MLPQCSPLNLLLIVQPQDADNNTILILLAGLRSGTNSPYHSSRSPDGLQDAALRMARSYHERFPFILDWSNVHGKTALHLTALKGNEDFAAVSNYVGPWYSF